MFNESPEGQTHSCLLCNEAGKKIAELQTNLETAQRNIGRLNLQITPLERKNRVLEEELRMAKEEMRGDILYNKWKGAEKKIAELQGKIELLTAAYNGADQQRHERGAEIRELQAENEKVSDRKNELFIKNMGLISENAILDSQLKLVSQERDVEIKRARVAEHELDEAKSKISQIYDDRRDRLKTMENDLLVQSRQIEGLRSKLELILPLAKGYAAEHPVGSNLEYVKSVESLLSPAPSEKCVHDNGHGFYKSGENSLTGNSYDFIPHSSGRLCPFCPAPSGEKS